MTAYTKMDPRQKPSDEFGAALKVMADAITRAPGKERESLLMVATAAICMIHGTYGTEFCRDFLRGATQELDLPDALKIELTVKVRGGGH